MKYWSKALTRGSGKRALYERDNFQKCFGEKELMKSRKANSSARVEGALREG